MRRTVSILLVAVSFTAWLFVSMSVALAADEPAGPAENTEPEDRFSTLDTNGDGVLSGREARDLKHYDRDRDGDITPKEYRAGNRRLRFLDPASEPKRAFRELDDNGDAVLSGRERQGVETFDTNGDGDITEAEFLAARARITPVKPMPGGSIPGDAGTPKNTPPPGGPDSTPKPVVRTDPRLAAWDDKLRAQFDGGKKWAVLIGIDGYKKDPLKMCCSDARLMSETLVRYCGYSRERIVLIIDKDPDVAKHPTKSYLQQAVTKTLREVGENDTVLISYAGHGFQLDGQSFLCPLDFDGEQALLTGWRTDEIRSLLQGCKAAQKLLVLDCCHSGGALTTSGFGATPQEVGQAFAHAQGLITLAACRTNQESLEIAARKRGAFTDAFCRGLAGEADADGNRTVDSDEIYRHVLADVPAAVAKAFPGRQQTPVRLIGQDVVGVFALSQLSAKPPEDVEDELLPRIVRPGDTIENSIGMKFTVVAPGLFARGSTIREAGRNDDEGLSPIILSQPMLLGTYEVTQRDYERVMKKNPSNFSMTGDGSDKVAGLDTATFPVEQVSWYDARAFCEALSKLPAERAAGRAYRLPTEAEWEYACRAGTTTPFFTGETITSRDANIRGDQQYGESAAGPTLGRPTNVGMYGPNRFGLYDMHGNVAEWTADYYQSFIEHLGMATDDIFELVEKQHEPGKIQRYIRTDPTGPRDGELRVFRGGSFQGDVGLCRSAARLAREESYKNRAVGFRVVCVTGSK